MNKDYLIFNTETKKIYCESNGEAVFYNNKYEAEKDLNKNEILLTVIYD